MRKRNICQTCFTVLGSKRITITQYSKFVALKEYKVGCLFYVTDTAFQIAVVIEQVFLNL
jgi:hypothetical protein